ncbi:hypothetical protein ACV1C1_22315, partial [Aeromonas caviae]
DWIGHTEYSETRIEQLDHIFNLIGIIEAALAHSDKDEVRSAYNRTDYLERRREMMVWWSEYIDAASRVGSALTWLPSSNVS